MKKFYIFLLTTLIGLSGCDLKNDGKSADIDKNIQMETIEKKDNGTYLMRGKDFSLLVDPQYGGRPISLKIEEEEIFIPKEGDDQLTQVYGSILWLSPQIAWNVWPPPAELDSMPYVANVEDSKLMLESDISKEFSIKFLKEIKINLEKNRIESFYRMENHAEKEQQFGLWEVTRLPKGGIAFFPIGDPMSEEVWEGEPFFDFWYWTKNHKPFFAQISISGDIFWQEVPVENKKYPKVMADGKEGWAVYVRNGIVFIKQYEDEKPEGLTPYQGEVEIYVDEPNDYLELEVQSSYRTIPSQGSTSWQVNWYVRRLPESVTPEVGSAELIQFVRETLK